MAKRLDADALERAVQAYFDGCDATEERTVLKNGAISCRQVPYTLAGLADALNMSREEISRYASKGSGRVRVLLSGALRRIERYLIERALLGELQQSVAARLLCDLGYGPEPAAPDGKRIVIVMDDQERWGD